MMKSRAAIEYRFESERAGYAAGDVTLFADIAGEYRLLWADDEKPLDGWFPVTTMILGAGENESFRLSGRVAIPVGATRLVAVCGERLRAVYIVPAEKRLPYTASDRSYRFGALADIHIDLENGGRNIYFINAEHNFRRALAVCEKHDADFIVIAGDMITNASGAEDEWRRYRQIIAESGWRKPIYEAIGNHETRFSSYGNCTRDSEISSFIANTGLDEIASHGKPYFEITEPHTGDHFLFMALEAGYHTAAADNFSDDQIAWIEGLLDAYSGDGRRLFLIQHAPSRAAARATIPTVPPTRARSSPTNASKTICASSACSRPTGISSG